MCGIVTLGSFNEDFDMSIELNIQRLGGADAAALIALRREALETEPLAFGASAEDDVGLLPQSVRTFLGDHEEQAVFGQFDGADLIGMIGLIRASKVKQRHKAAIWGMYVLPRARNKGIGRTHPRCGHSARWRMGTCPIATERNGSRPYRETVVRKSRVPRMEPRTACVALEGALR
jgi:GNAT superfamily N-acetyltransferase